MRRVSWQQLRDVCKLVGCIESRVKGDHLVMTKPGMARPVVIKMAKELGEDIIRTNMQTMGIDRKEFMRLLEIVRRHRRA